MMDRNEISVVNVCKNEHICLELFQVWVLNFSLKDEQPSSKCGWISAFCNIFYMQGLGTCFVHTGILAWHLFSLGLLKLFFWRTLTFLVLYCFVLLNGMAGKGYISFPQTSRLWKENEFIFIFSKMKWQLTV